MDPYQGTRYTEPAEDQMEGLVLEQIYRMTAGKKEDYVNSLIDRLVIYRRIHSFYSDSEEAFNDWKKRIMRLLIRGVLQS